MANEFFLTKNNIASFPTFLFIILSILLPGLSQAADMPVFQRLQPITSYITTAVDVATDQAGRLYVVQSAENNVLVFDGNGQYSATLQGLSYPLCVDVTGDSSRLYIGNRDSADVEVYDSAFNLLFKLGSGNGEFIQPHDLKIAASGKAYVVDRGADMIKVYNTDGTFSFSFGSSGSGDGEFHRPVSIAVDEGAGELIVLDHQLSLTNNGIEIDGARLQIFDMNGIFKRGFTKFGISAGNLFKPQRVTVDGQGGLYVTDSYHNVVFVYDSGTGAYLGAVYNRQNPLRTPMGVTMAGNKLYVAARGTGRIEMYQVDYTMAVSPLLLTFQAQEGGGNPAAQNITITNNDTAAFSWSAVTGDSWVTVSPLSGTLPVAQTSSPAVGVDLSGLAAGTYNGRVDISAGAATATVDIVLTVTPAPRLSVTPLSLSFVSTDGSVPADQGVSIENISPWEETWTAVINDSWITMSTVSETIASGAVSSPAVGVAPGGLAAGTYNGRVDIRDKTGAVTDTINVELTVTLSPRLSVNPASLSFSSTDGSIPAGQVISIANTGSGTLSWSASTLQSWIQLDKTSGTGGADVTVTVDISSLDAGDHSGVITLSGQGALSSPTHIGVNLTIIKSTPVDGNPSSDSGDDKTSRKKFPWILFMHLGAN